MRTSSRAARLLTGLALAGIWLSACDEPPSERAAPGTSPAGRLATGADLQDPPELVSHNGVLRTTLVVDRRKVWVGDRQLWALTYNDRYMPPTLRVQPGDRIELAMVNRVGAKLQGVTTDTNLHTHGLHVSPRQPADDPFISIKPGTTYHYSYQLPRDITPGTYWYHSHIDMYSAAQVAGGESGIIIVDGLRKYLPTSLRTITEHVIALKDDQVLGDAIKIYPLSIQAKTNRTVNGQQNPVIHIRPGETQLWRLANIGANIYYKLRLKNSTFYVIAQDGFPVHRIYSADTLIIPAGGRYDVLVQGGTGGIARLETQPFYTGPAGNKFPQANLATVITSGPSMVRARVPSLFGPLDDLSHAEISARKTLVYTEKTNPDRFYINGKAYNPNRVDFVSRLNTVEEWTVRNDTQEDHSFHVHTNQFQVMSLNGKLVDPAYSWHETVNVLRGQKLVLRIRFTDFTGRTLLHCHLLNHEDRGMMAVLDIIDGRSDREKGQNTDR
ncbi:multicopper oxidase family protein [Streptomyces sp. NPDC047022]|uniref:multicopper oxidase family protein n=1 Tax=Streptomyces sp. NPDC047022 TaxID=3155737 RepID=UPI0033D30E5B